MGRTNLGHLETELLVWIHETDTLGRVKLFHQNEGKYEVEVFHHTGFERALFRREDLYTIDEAKRDYPVYLVSAVYAQDVILQIMNADPSTRSARLTDVDIDHLDTVVFFSVVESSTSKRRCGSVQEEPEWCLRGRSGCSAWNRSGGDGHGPNLREWRDPLLCGREQ